MTRGLWSQEGARQRARHPETARRPAVAPRPDEKGTLGRPVTVKSNSACVSVASGMEVFQHDVTFYDAEGNLIEKLPEARRRAIIASSSARLAVITVLSG